MRTFVLTLLSLAILGSLQAQTILEPTIEKVDNFDELIKERKAPKVSNNHTYYLKPYDETPISLMRNAEREAALHVKGRGSLNHVKIYKASDSSPYPIKSETFRGANYQEVALKGLQDGEYVVRVISNHSVTETTMELRTLGAD